MGVREIDRSLEQWQMGVKDLQRRMILAPTPRDRDRERRRWSGTPTLSDVGRRPSVRKVSRAAAGHLGQCASPPWGGGAGVPQDA